MDTNRRMSRRHQTLGLMSNVFDGRSAVMGVVKDISRDGICVSNIPAAFHDTADTCYMMVNGPRRDFYLALKPRWTRSTNNGMYKTIGFHIERVPNNWASFMEDVEQDMCAQDPFCSMMVDPVIEM